MFVSENEFRHGKEFPSFNRELERCFISSTIGVNVFLVIFSEDNEARLFNRLFHLPLEEQFF
ncbi:hypothetical protein BpHYR1_004342 [Brachionus plicatilis]|uniref:Uncharacterized protein n=1 Tax=Brachionus plicatilis TaxID=10195 RepID=A0A3M7RFT4_BRAPC|nr:hypothetical protein BpHYR1_004342 [Brachionus plicatilis]